jgi:hypothetical protein
VVVSPFVSNKRRENAPFAFARKQRVQHPNVHPSNFLSCSGTELVMLQPDGSPTLVLLSYFRVDFRGLSLSI